MSGPWDAVGPGRGSEGYVTGWTPTMNLRLRRQWVSDERAELLLQQQWRREAWDGKWGEVEYEWRDVPHSGEE